MIACRFEFGECCSCLVLGAEFRSEAHFKIPPGEEGRNVSGGLILEDAVRIESRMSGLHEGQGPVDLGLFILELVLAQGDVEPARVQECSAPEAISVKVIQSRWLQAPCSD